MGSTRVAGGGRRSQHRRLACESRAGGAVTDRPTAGAPAAPGRPPGPYRGTRRIRTRLTCVLKPHRSTERSLKTSTSPWNIASYTVLFSRRSMTPTFQHSVSGVFGKLRDPGPDLGPKHHKPRKSVPLQDVEVYSVGVLLFLVYYFHGGR